ncbi:uncharacterized protein LOC127745546 [Arachis duranensis]|uniref:Uncharacterized protein LOC127745546 n=1 Tax=Arachis duranensis TaxID=130453 RepID=A0A9C6WTM8_ARADU|nr:uncharacterized protein LOC127745546 [Arachis duranensis]
MALYSPLGLAMVLLRNVFVGTVAITLRFPPFHITHTTHITPHTYKDDEERKRGSRRHIVTIQPIAAAVLPPSRRSQRQERQRRAKFMRGEREAKREEGGNPRRRRSWSLRQNRRRRHRGASLSPRAAAIEASAMTPSSLWTSLLLNLVLSLVSASSLWLNLCLGSLSGWVVAVVGAVVKALRMQRSSNLFCL